MGWGVKQLQCDEERSFLGKPHGRMECVGRNVECGL